MNEKPMNPILAAICFLIAILAGAWCIWMFVSWVKHGHQNRFTDDS